MYVPIFCQLLMEFTKKNAFLICQGDNGDPLLVDGVQLGIVSWSLACLQTNEPTVFTQVSAYIDWINSRIN